eukprot:TRINITY_DN4705_c0_g1_i1.p1 TRINITY_DN4705_c0_g1~~TRINITY_DN4705_c0_g1_i1.p1  ORF type:complete len:462 (+),score=123.39 TRINITY_DN4705_c0_g1_i1:1217-2602(+)
MDWKPFTGNILAIGCRHGVCVWHILSEPVEPPLVDTFNTDTMSMEPTGPTTATTATTSGTTDTTTPMITIPSASVIPTTNSNVTSSNQATQAMTLLSTATATAVWSKDCDAWMNFLRCPDHQPVTCLSWSPKGRFLAIGSINSSTVLLWDSTLETFTTLSPSMGLFSGITVLCWSPDGNYLMAGATNSVVRIWETLEWTNRSLVHPLGDSCQSAAWCNDGCYLAIAYSQQSTLTFLRVSACKFDIKVYGECSLTQYNETSNSATTSTTSTTTAATTTTTTTTITTTTTTSTTTTSTTTTSTTTSTTTTTTTTTTTPFPISGNVPFLTPPRPASPTSTTATTYPLPTSSSFYFASPTNTPPLHYNFPVCGKIREVVWDPTGHRLAVSFQETDLVAILIAHRTADHNINFSPLGFFRGPAHAGLPRLLKFCADFPRGALLTMCWENGQISFCPMYFTGGVVGC